MIAFITVLLTTISGWVLEFIRKAPFWQMLTLIVALFVVVPIALIEVAYRARKLFENSREEVAIDNTVVEVKDCQVVLDLHGELPLHCVQTVLIQVRIVNQSPETHLNEYRLEIVEEAGNQYHSSRIEDSSEYWQLERQARRTGVMGGTIEDKEIEPLRNLAELPLAQNVPVDGWLAFCFSYEALMNIKSVTLTLVDSSGRSLQCVSESSSWNPRGEIVIKDELMRITKDDIRAKSFKRLSTRPQALDSSAEVPGSDRGALPTQADRRQKPKR